MVTERSRSMEIKFNGINGTITESSPHGNYLVVELGDKITVCGTFSNKWNWLESQDIDSGFISFITYIGVNDETNLDELYEWIEQENGFFKDDEREPRNSKRVSGSSLELKVRGLSPEAVTRLVQFMHGY